MIRSRTRLGSLLFTAWILVGIWIAVAHSYITVGWVKSVVSALLAVLLWPLVLLGVDVHLK
ncbi:MAG: hypothetical protein U0Q15_16275 [Kineosporiaceae bacterium]